LVTGKNTNTVGIKRNIERYEEAKRRSKYLVRGAKEEYERSIALNMKGDNKIFCKYIQSKTKTIKHCAPRISSKMATIDECIEFALKNIGL
jgi:hypothetical protein